MQFVYRGGMSKALDFTDLQVWKEGHGLAKAIYLCTKEFPGDEIFGLTNQIRRAAVSVTSNVAEAHGRVSHKEKLRFYLVARGSLVEVQNQLLLARDVGYLQDDAFFLLCERVIKTLKLLNGIIRYCRKSFPPVP
ncbi:MAG: hypothetical protein AMXMBFR44_2700 [Candidatus Campbellbacteria bacterium]